MAAPEPPESVTQCFTQESPIPRLVRHLLFNAALREQADELRLEPQSDGSLLMWREVGGVFEKDIRFPAHMREPLVAHFQHLAGLDADDCHERTGEFTVRQSGRSLHGKIIFTRTEYGEQISAIFTS